MSLALVDGASWFATRIASETRRHGSRWRSPRGTEGVAELTSDRLPQQDVEYLWSIRHYFGIRIADWKLRFPAGKLRYVNEWKKWVARRSVGIVRR